MATASGSARPATTFDITLTINGETREIAVAP